MIYFKFKFLVLTYFVIVSSQSVGQTNLVANGSFEEFIPFGSSLASTFAYHDFLEDNLLFTQNYYVQMENNPTGNLSHIVHQLDCWETYDYDASNLENSYYRDASIIVLSANQGALYLSNPNGVFPFGVPYPADNIGGNIFGVGTNALSANTYPTNSESYVALITHRYHGSNNCVPVDYHPTVNMEKPRLTATLIEELVPGKAYTFKIDIQKIAHLNSICSTGPGPYDNKDNWDPNVKIRVFKSDGTATKTIFHHDIDHTDWDTKEETFQVNSAGYDRIEIILDKSHNANRGIFIDNVQLYAECPVEPENICENPELFKPLLNIEIKKLHVESSGLDSSTYILKTVWVTGLEVANYAKMTITNLDGTVIYRTVYDNINPPADITWDGKNDSLEVMPDGWYKCTVVAANLCYQNTFTKKFYKSFEAQVFNPTIEKLDNGSVKISGLYDAAMAIITVENVLTGIEFTYVYPMPEGTIAWNGTIDAELGSTAFVEDGVYTISVDLQSKCGFEEYTETFTLNNAQLSGSHFLGLFNDPLYDWGIVPDKEIPDCIYWTKLSPFYRVPKDCCVGDLYLDGDSLWGDMTFNILGTVFISDNVVADPGSIIIINAGDSIIVSATTELSLGSNVHLNPSVICDCNCNKSYEYDHDSILIEKIELDSLAIVQPESVKLESVKLTPNPATDFVSVLIPESKNYTKYELFNSKGEIIFEGQVISKEFRIDISKLTAGEYFIRFTSETERETVKLIVQ